MSDAANRKVISMESSFKANAELVRRTASQNLGVDAGYDEAGVRWLDDFLNQQRQHGAVESKEKLPQTLGSYFGECIIATYSGRWLFDKDLQSWSINFSEGNSVYPFAKVRKQLESGDGESVLSLFTSIPLVFGLERTLLSESKAHKRAWWRFW